MFIAIMIPGSFAQEERHVVLLAHIALLRAKTGKSNM